MQDPSKFFFSWKIVLCILVFGANITPGKAQNLVPNPSFEDTIHCPTIYGYITQAKEWFNPTTPNGLYVNACASPGGGYSTWGVPWNQYAYQLAQDGSAYIMLATFAISYPNIPSGLRYYAETELMQPLQGGQKYLLQFYVSLADSSAWGCDMIGAYFSDTMVYSTQTESNLSFEPQIENPGNHSLNNKADWQVVSDTFIAEGGESFVLIGNFRDSAATQYYKLSDGASWSNGTLILVDNISLIQLKDVGIQDENDSLSLSLYPNPVNDYLSIHVHGVIKSPYSISIKSAQGVEVFSRLNTMEKELSIGFGHFANGVYYLFINDHASQLTEKVIKIY